MLELRMLHLLCKIQPISFLPPIHVYIKIQLYRYVWYKTVHVHVCHCFCLSLSSPSLSFFLFPVRSLFPCLYPVHLCYFSMFSFPFLTSIRQAPYRYSIGSFRGGESCRSYNENGEPLPLLSSDPIPSHPSFVLSPHSDVMRLVVQASAGLCHWLRFLPASFTVSNLWDSVL